MGEATNKRKRGAPEGNQNARKHGFYSRVLDKRERAEYERAVLVESLDEEIALLRVKLSSLIARDPENVKLILSGLNMLVRLVKAKYTMHDEDEEATRDAIKTVLKSVALPMGIGIGTGRGKVL